MSSTRYQRQPMQIYQDPETYDRAPMPSMNSTAKKAVSPLRPIKNASTRRNVVFNPPSSAPSKPSPLKPSPQNSSSPTNAHYHSKLNMISMPPPSGPSYNTDSMEKKNLSISKFSTVPQKALFTTFSSARQAGKENYHPIYPAPPGYNDGIALGNFNLDVNQGIYGQKSQGKRALLEAASIQDSRPMKKVKAEAEPLVSVKDQLPSVHDDGTKPGHSYAQLIGIAILSAPNRRLTLAQIYKWISDTYKYYNASDAGWQNSIRHNLSLNKAFVKQERPKDDPGKGSYWAIEQGMEGQFYKDKPSRKSTSANENITVLSSAAAPSITHEPVNPPSRASFPTSDLPQSSLFAAPESEVSPQELSSDATIPASDAPEEEHDEEERYNGPPSSQPIPSSPLNEVRSSPPVHHVHTRRSDTPPPVPRFPPSSRNKSSHKRGFASMDDSGYFSSLSSGLRGHGGNQLTSDIDRPRIKRGRAEEEIARLRGSSYDSPTKPRSLHHGHSLVPDLSSPLRRPAQRHQSNQMLPPLTPAVKLKPPQRPPPSVSPNTNLKLHRDRVRQLVGSPERGMASLDENFSWSPAFRIDDSYMNINYEAEFDIFADAPDLLSIPGNGSPEKRSAKRMRVDRSHSANILSDISITKCNTNTNRNITSAPLLDFTSTPMLQPSAFPSPSKFFMPSSPNKMRSPALDINSFDLPQEDFFGAEFLVDEMTEFSGLDIMQGFQKIGAGGQHGRSGSTTKGQNARPPIGRSFTSRF